MYKFVLLVVCCAISAVIVVSAYDFKDSEYNEYLIQDLIDIAADDGTDEKSYSGAIRNKRETTMEKDGDDKKCKESKKKHHGFYKCCNDDANTEALHDSYKDMKKQCLQEVRGIKNTEKDQPMDLFSCEKMNKTKEEYVCVTECVGKKINILDKTGNLIEEAVKKHVRDELSVTEWQKSVADKVAMKCLADTKEALKSKKSMPTDKCNSAGLIFSHCVWREFTKSCPKDMQSDSKKCTNLREKLERGENIDFRQYHHKFHGRSELADDE